MCAWCVCVCVCVCESLLLVIVAYMDLSDILLPYLLVIRLKIHDELSEVCTVCICASGAVKRASLAWNILCFMHIFSLIHL